MSFSYLGKLIVDNAKNEDIGLDPSIIVHEEKVEQTNETNHESNLDGAQPNTIWVPGTTEILGRK